MSHREGQEKAIDRLEQVREELECHREEYKEVITREIEKVQKKKLKVRVKLK
jgi:hypothetical protein